MTTRKVKDMEDGLLIYLLDSALKSICEKVSYGS